MVLIKKFPKSSSCKLALTSWSLKHPLILLLMLFLKTSTVFLLMQTILSILKRLQLYEK